MVSGKRKTTHVALGLGQGFHLPLNLALLMLLLQVSPGKLNILTSILE